MDKQDDQVEVTLMSGLDKGEPYIILSMSTSKVTLSLEDAKKLLRAFLLCIETAESGYERYKEHGKTKET